MTDGRCWDTLFSGELALPPLEELLSLLAQTLREMVNLVGSLPSLRSRSGRRRRRALMNQLHIWKREGHNEREGLIKQHGLDGLSSQIFQ